MKKIISIMMLLLFCLSIMSSCNNNPIKITTDTNSKEENDTDSDTDTDTDSDTDTDTDTDVEEDTKTVKGLLKAALLPIGGCVYVYGGGWNEEDTGAGTEAMTIGVSARWKEYYDSVGSDYNWENTKYQIHDGLDCTGYLGFVMYQLFQKEYSENGYVFSSSSMAEKYREIFGGTITETADIDKVRAGDIMTKSGHVYIIVGQCSDGSRVLLHSSYPAVALCATVTPNGDKGSEAAALVEEYMKNNYHEQFEKFGIRIVGESYLNDYKRFSFDSNIIKDPDNLRQMSASEVLKVIFE